MKTGDVVYCTYFDCFVRVGAIEPEYHPVTILTWPRSPEGKKQKAWRPGFKCHFSLGRLQPLTDELQARYVADVLSEGGC